MKDTKYLETVKTTDVYLSYNVKNNNGTILTYLNLLQNQ